jgi:hypothetical protein
MSVTCHPEKPLTWVRQIPFPPASAVFTSIDVLLTVRPLCTHFNQASCNLGRCQTASGVSSSYDTLLALFERLGNFFNRLKIYVRIPPTTMMTDIIIKIMVQVLSVLALGTKQIKQGWISRYNITYIAHGSVSRRVVFQKAVWEQRSRGCPAEVRPIDSGRGLDGYRRNMGCCPGSTVPCR